MSIAAYAESWRISLRAENRSVRTIETYLLAVKQLESWLVAQGRSTDVDRIARVQVEGFITHVLDTRSSATAKQRHMSLRSFFRWLVEEEEIATSPMTKMRPPKVDERPPPILTRDQLSSILGTTSGKAFEDRRDAAIMLVLIDAGVRASELVGLKVDDVSLEAAGIWIRGKGGKFRSAPLGFQAVRALDRYLRARTRHPYAGRSDALFLGARGPITRSGLGQIVARRGKQAGIGHVYPHLFRHSFVHHWLADGGQEGDVASILGWTRKSAAQLLGRYGASAANERAHVAHANHGLGDQL